MPDFKGLDPVIVNQNTPELPSVYNPAPTSHNILIPTGGGANPESEDIMHYYSVTSDFATDDQTITGAELKANKRYDTYNPNVQNQEDYAAYGQSWGSKMVSGVGKGLALTGTTFLQSTVGMVNGLAQWKDTGKFSSFYNNDFNKALDDFNKDLEDRLPNYYSDVEKNAHWYQGSKLFTANFFWDGIIKNMGFSAGAALSGSVFAAGLKGLVALPGLAKLVSVGKQAEALAATEAGIAATNNAAQTYGKVKSLSDKFLGSFNALNTGQRVVVAGLATSGEAGFEAYQNLNQFRTEKIEEYKASHYGEEPTGEELEAINKAADSVGNASFGLNVALLTATNYIQFPKILGSSYTVEKGMINSLTRETDEIVEQAGKYIAKPKGNKILGALNRVRPFLFSTSEGFEEGAQYAIQTGTQDYYDKKYKHQDNDFMNSLVEGVKQTLGTDEGMENVVIGGLSGAMMMAKGKIQKANMLSRNTQAALSSATGKNAGLNTAKLSDFTKETIESVNRGVAIQEEREDLLKSGDITGSKDAETDYIINYLTPRIKYGRFDLVKSDIELHRQLASTDEGFAELQKEGKALEGDTKEAYSKRLNSLEATADNVKSLYQSLHLRYGSQVDNKGKPLYTPAVMDKLVYAATKVADYDNRIPSLTSTLIPSGVDVNSILSDVNKGITESFDAAMVQIDSLDILDEEKVSMKQALEDVGIMSVRRSQFLKEYTEIKNSPQKFQESAVDEEKLQKDIEEKKTITIKTLVGDKDLEVGTRYYLGKGYDYDKEGLETYIPISELTIIGENEDGTIKIKDHNGKISDISKSTLESYKLGKVEDVEKNENSSFFYRNRNRQIFWNLGKAKGGKISGRLSYDSLKGKLTFVYIQKGKLKEIIIGLDQFKPKGTFKEGVFSFGEDITLTPEDMKNIQDREDSGKHLEDQKRRRESRLNILGELYDEVLTEQIKIEERIARKKKEIDNIAKELSDLQEQLKNPQVDNRYKKEIRYKTATLKAMENVRRLSKMQDEFEKQILDLEAEKEELQSHFAYIDDMSQNLDELPTDISEFLEDLKDQKNLLEDLILSNSIQIEETHKIIDKIKVSLEGMYKYLSDLIDDFKKKYPNAPTAIVGQPWIDFLQSNPNFLKLQPNFKEDLQTLEDIVSQVEDLDITPDERTVQELQDKINQLQETIPGLEKELKSKQLILNKFQKVYDDYKKQKAEEIAISKNKKLIKDALGTADKSSIPTRTMKENFEAARKKAVEYIWRSTMGVLRGKDYQVRANTFGANLEKFENRDDIRGVYITHKNEGLLIKGLMDHLVATADLDAELDREDIVTLVMVDSSGKLVGEDGKPLTEEQLKDPIAHAIYQTFPEAKLQWGPKFGNGSMFRKGTPEEVETHVREEYAKWRTEVLQNETIDDLHTVGASFGVPKLEVVLDENGNPIEVDGKQKLDYSNRTSVEDAGLIEEDQFIGDPLITIPKNNSTVSQGTTSYDSPLGLPFLRLPNAVVPLQNRQHTSDEANTIFKVILTLAKQMMDPNIGVKHPKSLRLLNYLSSVTYWGIPTTQEGEEKDNVGYNSIFWTVNDEQEFMLTMGREGKQFSFTPTSLEENKEEIIVLLTAMYNNINSSMAAKVNESYEEITDIDANGEVMSNNWVNYQTYLLSNKFISDDSKDPNNGKPRSGKELPLSTVMSPLKSKTDVNRTGIYFYTEDTAGDIELPEVKPPAVIRPNSINKPVTPKPGKFVLDGTTRNTITGNNNQKIIFTANTAGKITIVETEGDYRKILTETRKSTKTKHPELTTAEIDARTKKDITAVINNAIKQDLTTTKSTKPEVKVEEDSDVYVVADEDVEEDEDVLIVEDEEESTISEVVDEDDDDAVSAAIFARIKSKGKNRPALRVALTDELSDETAVEDWTKLEAWLKKNFPNLPVYRVKNFIKATNGRQAWGMLQDGALYIMDKAQAGTGYHEVFEGVWKMFSSPEEQISIINEFNNRPGTFIDRPTGKVVKYADATPQEVKEELAEEFRDYVQNNKIPYKPKDGRPFILKLFSDLVNAIKALFASRQAQSKVEEMFKHINEGHYKDAIPYETNLSFAKQGVIDIENATASEDSEFSLVGVTDQQRAEIIEEMTYQTLYEIIQSDESLFNVMNKKKSDLYAGLKSHILETIAGKIVAAHELAEEKKITDAQANATIKTTKALMNAVSKQWAQISARHEEYLKSHSIEFDENDEITLVEEKSKDDPYGEANKVDHLKKANAAIKLLLSTIPRVNDKGDFELSSIGGVKLIPMSQAFVSIMSNVHTARNMDDMISKLQKMANDDPDYRVIYNRITKRSYSEPMTELDLSKVKTEHGLRLIASFWRTFKKQSPEVKNVFILENGEVVVGSANLSTAAAQMRDDYLNNIVFKAKEGSDYFTYDKKKKAYVGNTESVSAVKLASLPAMISFLKKLGIEFDLKKVLTLKGKDLNDFKEAVSGIKDSISKGNDIVTFSGKALSINGRLLELGYIQASLSNPDFDSTFFNINNERTQTYIGTNPASDLHDFLSQLSKFDQANLGNTQYSYLLTDVFSKGSVILKKMFTPKGLRKQDDDSKNLMRVAYIGGIDNQIKGKQKQSSKLSYKERLVQELNLNLAGYYLTLIPGDASMEWATYMGNHVSVASINKGMRDINLIFRDYFTSELELARETSRNVDKNRKGNEMRFFKSILGEDLHRDILRSTDDVDKVYADNEAKINAALNKFINQQNKNLQANLESYGVITEDELGFQFENVNMPDNMTQEQLTSHLTFLNVNFMINNIELHKLLYADPYQYADELKRIKNFNSPRQALIHNSREMNSAFDRIWNEGFKKGEIGWTNFTQDYFRSTTYKDVMGMVEGITGYDDPFKETDGGGVISFTAYRQFRIRTGEWNDFEEAQYKHDIAYEKLAKSGATAEELADFNKANPGVRSAYTPIKPIVSGNKANGESYNDTLLDKFALYPISYRLMTDLNTAGNKATSNAIKLYDKMQAEKIDYVVFESSRKVGTVKSHSLYNAQGKFDTTPYSKESIINVPFAIMSVQTEVPSKDDGVVTRGSQVTKLITMDYMEAGVPIDFMVDEPNFTKRYKAWMNTSDKETASPLYKEIKTNQNLLQAMMDTGYKKLLERLGIKESKGKYVITDFSKAAETLRSEILKREVNDNISDALTSFIQGKAILEATPAYHQVRNILYSIADKEVIKPKMTGGMKVLIPSRLLEEVDAKTIEINGKVAYTSNTLEFYKKDGKQVCEIMVGRWFKSSMSDADLLKYLNTTEEGQKILSGLAFRIPTQKQNSMESFVIKQFLPQEFGDSVILPAAMVAKTGGDFDIDKLTMYLKNTFKDENGKLRLIEHKGTEQATKDYFSDLYSKKIEKQIVRLEEKMDMFSSILTKLSTLAKISVISPKKILDVEEYKFYENNLDAIYEIIDQAEEQGISPSDYVIIRSSQKAALLEDKSINITLREDFVNSMYNKALQNAYVESSQNLVSHPSNYDRLVKPNSADQMKALSKEINNKLGIPEIDYLKVGNMLDRGFMSRLRHAFVSGKYAIGIAAVNQTNHSLNQRQLVYIDPNRLKNVSDEDKKWLGNAKIMFDKFNKIEVNGNVVATLSMIKNAEGQDISDIIAQFIDGYVDISKGPWIMEMGATPNVASTWMFLAKIGVPIDTVTYFMNQPIIRDYLKSVEVAGYTWLFMDNFVESMKDEYSSGRTGVRLSALPSKSTLRATVGKTIKEMNASEKEQQQFILDEFLKYAKMAEHMFHVTQGSNFDTATFNDPYLIFKKFEQLKKAQQTIISNVDDILANSFVGTLGVNIKKVRDSLATILKSDQKRVRGIIQQVLLPYVNMNDNDFVKIAQKAVNDLFDYAVQTNSNLNQDVQDILINDGGVGREVADFVEKVKKDPKHPLHDNYVIKIMQPIASKKAENTGVNNLKVKGLGSKTYDQNNIIYGFRQIREHLKGKSPLYNRIVQLAVLQSGLSSSNISFTSVLPYEDFQKIYNKVLSKLESISNLDNFVKLNVFQRNNWNNDDVTPYVKARLIQGKQSGKYFYNLPMSFMDKPYVHTAINRGTIPQVMTVRQMEKEANFDHIVYTWEKQEELNTAKWRAKYPKLHGFALTKQIKADMRKAGDFSYIYKGLFEKVKDNYGRPLETFYMQKTDEGKVKVMQYVYKAVNAWGDGHRANEFYDVEHKSVIDNGFIKVNGVDNNVIIDLFTNKKLDKPAVEQNDKNWQEEDNSCSTPF